MKMLNYSFKEFAIFMALVLFVFYGYVILRYYRKELMAMFSPKARISPGAEDDTEIIDPFENYYKPVDESPIVDENYQLAEELILRIKDRIVEASDLEYSREELLESLGALVAEYPTIRNEVLQAGISELILSECKINGTVSLSKAEVDDLWKMALS